MNSRLYTRIGITRDSGVEEEDPWLLSAVLFLNWELVFTHRALLAIGLSRHISMRFLDQHVVDYLALHGRMLS